MTLAQARTELRESNVTIQRVTGGFRVEHGQRRASHILPSRQSARCLGNREGNGQHPQVVHVQAGQRQ